MPCSRHIRVENTVHINIPVVILTLVLLSEKYLTWCQGFLKANRHGHGYCPSIKITTLLR